MEGIVKIQIDKLIFPNQADPVLKNIDLEIKKGDFLVITGGAASGKSVLLHTLTGAIPQFYCAELTGKITIMGQDIHEIPLNRMSDYVGYMMQEPQNQLISMNIFEEIAFGPGNLEKSSEEISLTVKSTLEIVGLKGYENRKTNTLSGGQAQRVVLAGVLAMGAPILILDQPTAELDPQGRYEIYKRLGKLNKTANLTVILVMDRIEEVLSYANRVLCMKKGEIIKEVQPIEYLNERNEYFKEKLKTIRQLKIPGVETREIIAKVTNASYQYKNHLRGCCDISLDINRGDFLSIIGVNGSGKSTLAKMLVGLLKPSCGEITVFDQPLVKGNLTKLRSRIGFLYQNPDYQIFADTVEDEAGFSLKLRKEPEEVLQRKIQECLGFVGLLDYKKLHPQRLSRGQRQLLALASIMAADPEFIIADEPTSGLDEHQGYMIMEHLANLSQMGKTVLLITHDLSLAKNYSTRIVAMHDHSIKLDIKACDLHAHLSTLENMGLKFDHIR